ncbi:MAG: tetratricopeptide repeat protein, partial [Actinomycetota bacterium]|nr:tetratricopeptide repeat protein [Actinomycetota bacterium]
MTTALDDADLALRHFDGKAALAGYEAALAAGLDPDGRASAGRVRALWLLRRWDDARDHLEALPDGVPGWLALGVVALGQPDYAAWLAVDRGSAKRDDDDALRFFKLALQHDAHNPEAIAGYATALRMSGQLTAAREHLLRLPQRDRETAPVQVELAMCAAELDDLDVAAEHARHALAIEPDHLHASLVLHEVSARIGRDLDKLVEQSAALLEKHPVPDVRIMHGNVLSAAGRHKLAVKAFAVDLPHPSAVHGTVLVSMDHAARTTIVVDALRVEPSSPLLRRCAFTLTNGGGPERALAQWRTVVEADPRDLEARLATADVLAFLDRTDEAREVVDQLRAELPGNVQVTEAWVRLATPWRMPETIPTRIARPWESGRDDRKTVLAMLVAEVVENLQLSREVADRLEARLTVDSGHVHRQAADDEQTYLGARDEHMAAVARAEKHKHWWFTGAVLEKVADIVVYLSVGLFFWLLLSLTALPGPLVLGLAVLPTAAVVGYFLSDLQNKVSANQHDTISVLATLAVLAALFWQGTLWWGTGGWGIAASVGFSVVVLVVLVSLDQLGVTMQKNFGPPSGTRPQEAFDRWLESLYGRGLLPAAAEASTDPDSASGVVLPVHCRIVSETATALDTPATRELRRLLRQRSRGNFALA